MAIKKSYTEVTVPLQKMTFTPDVPSAALGANEYNIGENIETDVRGIRSILGEEEILTTVPGIPTFITGGYRQSDYVAGTIDDAHRFWFIVATDTGNWYANNGVTGWLDITPVTATGFKKTGYTQAINITDSWNGTVPIFNDTFNAPFFWPDEPGAPKLVLYKQNIPPRSISGITVGTTTCTLTVSTAYNTAPFAAGDKILITNINNFFNGTFTVVSSTTTEIVYTAVPGAAYPGAGGTVSAAYTWNYNPNWQSVTAGFVRLYSTPNVGNILVAGNLTVVPQRNLLCNTTSGSATIACATATADLVGASVIGLGIPLNAVVLSVSAGVSVTISANATATNAGITVSFGLTTLERYPTTVAWSQAFGLNQAPQTWEPTNLNVANQVEIPVRGEVLDGWPSNGQFYLNSYWDTVVLSPLNYSTTNAPILGIRLFNQGRGMLTANCWANSDNAVYGIDARDIWVFDGNGFRGIGNQRVKHYFFDQLNPKYVDRIYVECNTEKNQVEIYYPDQDAATDGVPNKMISYRYDLDIWNPPRFVSKATYVCESPVWTDTYTFAELNPTNITGTGTGLEVTIVNTGSVYSVSEILIGGSGYAIGNTVKVLGTLLGGDTTANDCTLTVTAVNALGAVTALTAAGTGLLDWTYNKASRGMVYAVGATGKKLIQKDIGFRFVDNQIISSTFRRDNMKLTKDYSTKVLVHRVLPEIVNLNGNNVEIDPVENPELVGNVEFKIEGANSVGQTPIFQVSQSLTTDTDYPWVQINSNAHRVDSIELNNDPTTPDTVWMCTSLSFQVSDTEDDR
jgi:hypothetical protein